MPLHEAFIQSALQSTEIKVVEEQLGDMGHPAQGCMQVIDPSTFNHPNHFTVLPPSYCMHIKAEMYEGRERRGKEGKGE